MTNFKEIVTKAVIGKGKKNFITNHTVTPEIAPSTILGCWIINHNFKGYRTGESVKIEGSYDVNIWYSCLNDTKTEVVKQTNNYLENVVVPFNGGGDISSEDEVIVRSLKQPSSVKAERVDGSINYTVEKELGIELVGDTKIKIAIDDGEDPWQDLNDNKSDDVIEAIDKEVKDDFIN